jgi:VWFA-related protein
LQFLLALLILIPAACAQTLPLQVRPAERPETVEIRIPGAALPLERKDDVWSCTLELVYRVLDGGGREIDRATETVPLQFDQASREALQNKGPGPALTLLRPMPPGNDAAELRVEIVVKPAGTMFAGGMPVGAPTFRVDSGVALIPFRVEMARGRLAGSLTADDIEVSEDGVARRADLLAAGGTARSAAVPVDLTILYDRSGSMASGNGLDPEVFRKGLLEEFPNVRIAISGFSNRLVKLTGHTREESLLVKAAENVRLIPRTDTRLFASILETVMQFDQNRAALRLLAVFSDGVSTAVSDVNNAADVMAAARKAGVVIFPVRVDSPRPVSSGPLRPRRKGEIRRAAAPAGLISQGQSIIDFAGLSDTGGELFTILAGTDGLPEVLRGIAKSLRQTYVASYQPESGGPPRVRQARVVLKDKGLGKVIGGQRVVVR